MNTRQGFPKDSEGQFDIESLNIEYDDALLPHLGADNVQDAIDALKIGASSGAASLLFYGTNDIGSSAGTRFLTPGFANSGIAPVSAVDLVAPRAGTLKNLFARSSSVSGNGNPVVYAVMVNGVVTAMTVSLPTGAMGTASDLLNTVAVAQGDRVSIRAVKALNIALGIIDVTITLELA